jgi:micrococcal nuclease
MVFGQTVFVKVMDTDRYGRTVGMGMVNGKCLNEELVKAGFAWVYPQYCKKPICDLWNRYEEAARIKKKWFMVYAEPDTTLGIQKGRENRIFCRNENSIYAVDQLVSLEFFMEGFSQSGLQGEQLQDCIEVFQNRELAIKAGYKPCGMCKP